MLYFEIEHGFRRLKNGQPTRVLPGYYQKEGQYDEEEKGKFFFIENRQLVSYSQRVWETGRGPIRFIKNRYREPSGPLTQEELDEFVLIMLKAQDV